MKKTFLFIAVFAALLTGCTKERPLHLATIKYEISGNGRGYLVGFTTARQTTSWQLVEPAPTWTYEMKGMTNACYKLVLIPQGGKVYLYSGTVNIYIDGQLVATNHTDQFGSLDTVVQDENGNTAQGIETSTCK